MTKLVENAYRDVNIAFANELSIVADRMGLDVWEVIRLANATEFGLASYFYTRDVGRAWRVAEGLESGIVGINEGIISTEVAPFGGVKESGIGREFSLEGILDSYTQRKSVTVNLAAPPAGG